jgi:hypothetical protein
LDRRWFEAQPHLDAGETAIARLWTRASVAAKASELKNAAQIARVLLQLKPDDVRALALLGRVADAAGRAEAFAYYRAKAAAGKPVVARAT